MKALKLAGLIALVAAMAACGSNDKNGINNKDDAAKAMQKLSDATSQACTASQQQSPLYASGLEVSATVHGRKGTATVTIHSDDGMNMSADIDYNGYSADGTNVFDGTFSIDLTFGTLTETAMSMTMTMLGDVTMSGDYDASLEFDITETMTTSTSMATGRTTVTMTLDGSITADGVTYSFDNEEFTYDESYSY
jgi:hypothetical protein